MADQAHGAALATKKISAKTSAVAEKTGSQTVEAMLWRSLLAPGSSGGRDGAGSLWRNFTDDNQATLTSTDRSFRFQDDLDDVSGVGGKAGMRVAW